MNEQELNEFGLPKFKRETTEINEFGLPKFKRNQPSQPSSTQVGPAEITPVSPEQIQRGEFDKPVQEAPGFFGGLARQAKTTFGPQKEKSQILAELQQAPINYNEYVNKQKILYDQTKVAAPVRYDMFQSNPVPTEQDFNTLSLDEIKKKYGTSEIANRTKGLMGDENRFSISVGSLLDQVASVPKEQQASTFKNLVNDALRKVREQQVYRKGQLEYQMERETAGIPQTFGEAVSRGELGTYIGSAIGGAAGSSAVALTKPLVGGYELTKGEILDMANKAKAESLGQTENEFIVSGGKLDSNSAVEVGSMVSSALEYVGLGKIASPLFKNLVKEGMKSAMKKGIVEVGKGAAAEFSTEFVQSVNEQVSSQMAAGKKPEEIVINWDDALESGIQGGIGGGGLTTVSTVTSGLANAIAKRRKIEQIDNDINRLTDTGSPEINQQIDNELNLITPTGDLTYDQEKQIGVPSGEQQGAAPIQERPQPEGGRAETQAGGVLQVPPTTPGAQAEVTGIPVERKEIEVYRGTTTGNKSEKDGVSYYTPDRNYAAFYESGTEKAQNVALQELQDLKEPTKPTKDTPISENNLLESLGDLGYKFNSASEVKNRIDELDSKQNPTLKERTEDLDLSILYAEYDPVKVDGMNKFKQGEYEKDLAEYNKKKSELESKAKSYLSPKKLSGNFFNLGVDFSSMNPQQIFERLQSLGIATEFKGGNFLDNYHSDLVEFARKNNIEFFDGITGGIVGSLNVKPQEIIEVSKIAETAGLGEQVTPAMGDLVDEGLRDLDQLQPVTPEVTPQPVSEMEPQPVVTPEVAEEPIIIDKTTLTNAGYTSDQIKLVENNPDKFGQIDDKIVNLETNEVINPTGSKKPKPRAKKRPKETFAKKSFADLEKAMATPGVKLDELLRTVVGLNNDFSELAKQLLILYKSNRNLKIAKFSTQGTSQERRGTFGVYTPKNEVKVFIDKIKKNAQAEAKEANISAEELQAAIEYATSRVLIHEIIHAYTVIQMRNAIPALRYKGQNINALKAYQKSGDNQAIKDLITLYLSARDQVKALETTLATGGKEGAAQINKLLKASYLRSRGTAEYGFTDILEFITETFTNNQFQLLLNALDSPVTPNKSMWQSFVDAIKSILKLQTTVNGKVEELPVRGGSLLEGVLRVTPNIIPTEQGFAMGETLGAEDPRASALIKIAQGLINRGVTPENVIDKVKELVTQKYNIDVDAYAEDILAGINVRREAVAGPFNADTEVANVATSPYNQILTSQKPDDVSAADFKQQKVEAVADFLRGKATSKEQVQDFALAWNDSNPNNPISRAIANEAWDRLKTARPQPAATTTVKINDMIRTQAQIRAKGKAEGVRETTKQFREKLIKMVQDAIKASNLTRNQINSMLSAVKRVNLFTPGSINKLADRIAKLEADAAYADKVNQAKSLRSKIVSLARPKEAKVSNYTETARNFLKVDIDYLTTYAEEGYGSVDPLDDYIKVATAITNGFANPKLDRYERIIVANVQDYINTQLANKEKEVYREMLEGIDEESLSKVVEGASLQEWQKLLDTLQLQDRATELQEELRTMDNPDGILNTLNSANLEELTADELSTFVMVADNIIANEDYSMVDTFSNKIKARDQVNELKKSLGSVTKDKLVAGIKNLQQITQMLDAVFNFSQYAAVMYNLSGIYDYIAATARVENRKIATGKMIEDEMDRIDSKVMGVPSLRLETEQGKLAILSELAKYTVDSTEHMEKVKENLQLSIDRWKEKDPEFGDKMQKIYDGYKNVNSAEEAVEAFKKNDPHVHQLWEFISTKVFTKQLTDEVALNTRSVHNKVFVPFVNYMPTSLKTMEVEAAAPEQQRMSAKPVQSGTTKEAKRVLSIKQAYDFKDYINGLMYAYTETIHDIETSKHLQLFNYIANNPEFVNLIGGTDNKNAIVNRVIATDKIERRMGDQVDESLSFFNKIANGLSQIGVTTALGGLDQIALQYPSAAASALIMLGGDAELFFAAPTSLNDNLKKLLASQDISVRGQAHKYELSSQVFDLQSKNEIMRGIGKLRKGMAFIQKDLILKPLIMSDVSVAQRSYIAFYLKSLKDQGITAVDLSSEFEKRNEPSRKQALAYASLMLSNLQVASTSAGRSAFMQTPGNLGIIRKLIFPFSSFPINTKIRMIRAFNKMKSSPNKSEGVKELLAVMTEAATFSSVKIYLLPFYYAAVKAGMEAIGGFEAPEDEEDDEDKNWRKFKTQMALEAIPFNVGSAGAFGSQWMVNRLNYMLSETEARTVNEFLGDMGEDPMFERLQNWNKYNDFYGYGQFGIGMDRYADILNAGVNYFNDDYVTLDNGYREQIVEKDSDEIDRMALMNLIIQLSPSPREVRNQMNKIQREQFKMARERQKEESQ